MHFVKVGERVINLDLVIKVERTPTGKVAVHYAAPGMRHWGQDVRPELDRLYGLDVVPGHLIEFLPADEGDPLLAEIQRAAASDKT